jgi:carboxypeptidase PM20D1
MDRKDIYAEELSALIQYNTVSPCCELDMDRIDAFHIKLREMFPNIFKLGDVKEFDGSYLIRIAGKDSAMLPCMLMSHHDVVEALGNWKYPPFSGTIADGRVWGRGAIDNKAMFWAIMRTVDDYIAQGNRTDADLYIVTTCNEENQGGGSVAIAEYLKNNGIRFRFILDEGSMIVRDLMPCMTGLFAMIGVTEKSICDLKFIARGAGGHASVPPKNNPLARLAAFINEVETNDIYSSYITDTESEMLRRMAPYMTGKMKDLCQNISGFQDELIKELDINNASFAAMTRTTIAFTMANGSNASNVIPTEAYVIANMRCAKHISIDESLDTIAGIARKHDVDMEVLNRGIDNAVTDYHSPEFKLIENAVNKVFPGVITVPVLLNGGTDSRNFSCVCSNIMRFTAIVATPEQERTEHGIDEFIEIDSLPLLYDFIKEVLMSI